VLTQALGTTTSGFEGDFRFLADAQGLGTSAGRHPSANLYPVFNASYRSLRDLVLSYGYTQFLVRGATTALPITPVETNERYAVIAVPEAVNQVKMLDIRIAPDDWRFLPEVTILQLRELTARRWRGVADTPRRPLGWCLLTSGTVSGATYTAGSIAIAPVPTSGSYALWTMPEWADITTTTHVFLFANEDWRQWMLYDAMSKIVGARDKNNAAKLDFIMSRLNPNVEGSPAYNIKAHAPTAAGPRTWIRGADYHGPLR
jgi:hypothetical protein